MKNEISAKQSRVTFKKVDLSKYRLLSIFLTGYAFLSGFVFVEPSPAEWFFLIFVPFLLIDFSTTKTVLCMFFCLSLPLVISMYTGLSLYGYLDARFVTIDFYLFFFFMITASCVSTARLGPEQRSQLIDKIMTGWTYGAVINILTGLLAYVTRRISLFDIEIIYGLRLRGFFKDPNVLGPYIVPPAVYSLCNVMLSTRRRLKNALLFLLLTAGILLTFSRGAWLNYSVSLSTVVLGIIVQRKLRRKILTAVFLIVFSLTVILYLSASVEIYGVNLLKFVEARSQPQRYDYDRFATQRLVVEILESTNLVFGAGPGNYETYTKRMAAHSLYVRYLGERGFFGFALFILFLFSNLFAMTYSDFKFILIPTMIGQLANSFFIDSLHWRHLWLIIVLGMIRARTIKQQEGE